ncbi:cysteine hydrolase family protein [Oharaeibacter diazotrophicus]|uniref:Nicotinamidase-related amidase n=1 Tax=Oharaeibacter diazotrophicus TaxID=1920512 RepID=A0A4R6RAX2_9HYPH|nr:cysteine hydrolase family protein [Oharaeibacter diazotrophicus]TDP83144.1 nicotinamidase-related amidase [Oharaeibacter diazotrophicus]BBE71974.1 streptothricin hydrolase [Pleomorphomonas sp. SM30]GLS78737.1 isochorismatase [Oharaeibacter diazotrophicus]
MGAALIVIDLQNDYFPAGRYPLAGIEAAAANAATLIAAARAAGVPVLHVRHEEPGADAPFFARGTEGAETHPSVAPAPGEPVIVKEAVNAFLGTDLADRLSAAGVDGLIVTGAMSHMCVDAATRAALDLGLAVTVVHDATATRELAFGDVVVPAAAVQATLMAALEGAGAAMATTEAVAAGWRS